MVLVPLGISLNSWSRSIDPKSKSRTENNGGFTDDSGINSFHRVGTNSIDTTGGKNKKRSKKGLAQLVKTKIVSPIQQVLEQTKEKEKRSDAPDNTDISLNMSATSTMLSKKKRKKKSSSSAPRRKSTASSRKKTVGASIKRLQKKRIGQSKKKPSARKRSTKKSSS